MFNISKAFVKPATVVFAIMVGSLALTSCSVDPITKASQEAEQLPPSETFDPNLIIETSAKPSVSYSVEQLKTQGTFDVEYQTNITLDVPKKEYKIWLGKSSEPVIANFVSGKDDKAPYIEGLMSGTAEITLINSDTKEEFKITVNVFNKG